MPNFLIVLFIGIASIAMFAGFAIYMGDSNFFKKRQTEKAAQNSYNAAVRRAASLKSFEVVSDVTLAADGESYHFDTLLLSEYGTIAVNAVYQKGDIYGGANDDEWVCVPKTAVNHKEYFANPLKAQAGCVRFFKDLYKAEKVKGGNVDSIVVFPYSKTILYTTPKTINAFDLKGFKEKLTDNKYYANNRADIAAMKAAVEKYSVK